MIFIHLQSLLLKLVSDSNLKVWRSREMPPPLYKDIFKFWREEIIKGLVKDVLVIDEYEDGKLSKSFRRVWIVDNVITGH